MRQATVPNLALDFAALLHAAIQHFGTVTRENEQEVTRWVQVRIRERQTARRDGGRDRQDGTR